MVMNGSIQNLFLFCSELKKTTTGKDIFELVKKNIESRRIKWENCVSVCTDGALSMLGCKKGLVAYVLKVNPNVKIVHCMIHREAGVGKKSFSGKTYERSHQGRQLFQVKLTPNKNFHIVRSQK
jgi:hypothetical protein